MGLIQCLMNTKMSQWMKTMSKRIYNCQKYVNVQRPSQNWKKTAKDILPYFFLPKSLMQKLQKQAEKKRKGFLLEKKNRRNEHLKMRAEVKQVLKNTR